MPNSGDERNGVSAASGHYRSHGVVVEALEVASGQSLCDVGSAGKGRDNLGSLLEFVQKRKQRYGDNGVGQGGAQFVGPAPLQS